MQNSGVAFEKIGAAFEKMGVAFKSDDNFIVSGRLAFDSEPLAFDLAVSSLEISVMVNITHHPGAALGGLAAAAGERQGRRQNAPPHFYPMIGQQCLPPFASWLSNSSVL